MRIRSIVLALALLAGAATAQAQDGTLERVQNMIATGRLSEARNTLAEWEREQSGERSTATPDDRARALFLSGLLSSNAKAAEDAFLGVVLTWPYSAVAPEALLRLGQGLHTSGDNDRAILYLERLLTDYPSAPQRETGMLWLTRAQLADGDAAAACGTARESLFATSNENVRTLIELERDRACAQSGGVATASHVVQRSDMQRNPAAQPSAAVPPAAEVYPRTDVPQTAAQPNPGARPGTDARANRAVERAAPAAAPLVLPDLGIAVDSVPWDAPPERQVPAASTASPVAQPARQESPAPAAAARVAQPEPAAVAEFAVQTAAFSERRAAETIAAELRAKGFDARIVTVPGSAYFRVRFGTFMTSAEAAAAALRIRDAGFATLIVNDVRLERRP